MAIPTMLARFDGTVMAQTREGDVTLSTSGPVRYAPGMGGYPASRNLVRNPSFEDGTINGTSVADTGIVRSITTEGAYRGTYALRVDSDGTDSGFEAGVYNASITGLNTMGGAYTSQIWAKVPAGYTCFFTHRVYYTDDTSAQLSQMDEQVATGNWQYFEVTNYPRSDKIVDRILVLFKVRNVTSPIYYLLDACQTERGEVATPYFDGDSGPGHGWEGTQHDSASYREAWVHGGAALVEESTTNYIVNPMGASGADASVGWNKSGSGLLDSIQDGSNSWLTLDASSSAVGANGVGAFRPTTVEGDWWTLSVYYGYARDAVGYIRFYVRDASNAQLVEHRTQTASISSGQVLTITGQSPAGAARVEVGIVLSAGYVEFRAQLEKKTYATSFCPQFDRDGNLLPGYSWTGTAHASASTRETGRINHSANKIDAQTGSIMFRYYYKRDRKPNGIRYLFSLGQIAGVSPRSQIAPQQTTSGMLRVRDGQTYRAELIVPATALDDGWQTGYLSWTPDTVSIDWGDGVIRSGPRSEYTEPMWISDKVFFGDAFLTDTYSYPWNDPVGPFIVFDRPLTEVERDEIRNAPAWYWAQTISKISGVLMGGADGGAVGGADGPFLVGGVIMGEDQ